MSDKNLGAVRPRIGENGNWWIGQVDTGKPSRGETPVKGTDYYTKADKEEMVAAVLAALPTYDGEVAE